MKHRFITTEKRIGVIFLAISLASTGLFAQSLNWLTDYDEAKQRALVENKLILADFWASWCAPCIEMDRQTWDKPSVVSASDHLICVRLDFDKNPGLEMIYDVTAIPAMVILDGFGNKLFHMEGFKSEFQMASVLRSLPSNMAPAYGLIRQSQAAPDSIELKIAIGDSYQLMRMPQVSNQYYKELLRTKLVKKQQKLEYHIKSRMALNHHLLGNQDKAKDLFEECLANYLESPDRPVQLFLLAKINLLDKNEEEARKYLEMIRKEFPNDNYLKLTEDLFKK